MTIKVAGIVFVGGFSDRPDGATTSIAVAVFGEDQEGERCLYACRMQQPYPPWLLRVAKQDGKLTGGWETVWKYCGCAREKALVSSVASDENMNCKDERGQSPAISTP